MKFLSNLFIAVLGAIASAFAEPVDMVIFLSDDHTWRDSSVYGSPDIRTPNMERLAGNGLTFDRAYVASPACAPSRAALMTGLYPANNGAEPNHSRPDKDIKKLPSYLQELGYEVVSFGKVGHYAQTPEYDFDLARRYGYHEDIAIPEAIEWLRNRKSEKPLCLFVGSNWPHVPWPEDAKSVDRENMVIPFNHVDNPTTRQWRAKYVAAIQELDRELGEVYDAAREVLGDDVFFLHTSDHGAQWPFGKWNLYEDGVRTPMIVSWPGRISPDKRTEAMVSWIDILPTLVDVAGGEVDEKIDGRSFLPVLNGDSSFHRDRIFTTHSGDGNYNVYPSRAVIDVDGWKYIRNLHPDWRFESHATAQRGDGKYWTSWLADAVTNEEARERVNRYLFRPADELIDTNAKPQDWKNHADDPAHAKRFSELQNSLNGWLEATDDQLAAYGRPKKKAVSESPNIITVFIDDMGYSDLSSFGGERAETDHIDRLANEGIKFTQFYVNSPICSPSRVALSTGQYPQRWRISSYLNNRKSNDQRGMAQWLDPAAPMLARELQHNGYATGHFGKWHMGGQRDVGNAPLIPDYGFDRSLTNFEGLGPRALGIKDAYDGKKTPLHHLGSADLPTGPIVEVDRSLLTQTFVEAALPFIDQAVAANKPFFLNLWPDDVHSPFFPPEVLRDETDGSKRELYYAVLEAMDQQLSPLFDKIRDDEALRDNTLILLCSDNGHEPGAGMSNPLRGSKTLLYEGGVRSPLIVWGPGLLEPSAVGTTNDESVFSAIDVNRTLYSITNTPLPQGTNLDGENLARTLLGKTRESRQAPIFFRRPPDRPTFDDGDEKRDAPDLAVRRGKWKYLINYDGSDEQLYDLSADIGESRNLVADHPAIATNLRDQLFSWNADMPVDAGDPTYGEVEPIPATHFVNPIGEGADPWVVRDPNEDRYLWCFSEGNRAIAVHASENLTTFGPKRIVWEAPEEGPFSRQVWAPELHFIEGKWHIYLAASDGKNKNHLAYVIVSKTDDPLGDYDLVGPLATGDGEDGRSPNLWAIDMTPLEYGGQLYALWSGWDEAESDRQYLYIAPMSSPTEISGPRVRICSNDDHPWEFTENAGKGRGLNEGPQVLKHGGRVFVTYSCGGSWLPTYKLGMLELTGSDPLNTLSWVKGKRPVFFANDTTYGVGHSCFVPSPDGSEMWHVYHAKRDRKPGWRRGIFVQPMHFEERSLMPRFGRPIAPGEPGVKPSGEGPAPVLALPFMIDLREAKNVSAFRYYGHHQRYLFDEKGLHLGLLPEEPINDFPSGEKVMLEGRVPDDLTVEATIRFLEPETKSAAGIHFRTSGAGLGFDNQRGYFADVNPVTQAVNLGKMDGRRYHHLAGTKVAFDPKAAHKLSVTTEGNHIRIALNGEEVLTYEDNSYSGGGVGLRTVRAPVLFESLLITSGQKLAFEDAFDDGKIAGWKTQGGEWREGAGVLSAPKERAKSIAILENFSASDFRLEVDVRSGVDGQAGVVFHLDPETADTNAPRGYYLGMQAKNSHVMWGALDGGWHPIASQPADIRADEWHQLRLEVRGGHVRAWINQMPVGKTRFPKFDGIDSRFDWGSVGLRALGKAAAFRNFQVSPLDSEPPVNDATTYTNPVQADGADPVVLLHEGTYYLYCTYTPDHADMKGGIRLYTSENLADWQDRGYILTPEVSWGENRFWAPDIVEKDGTFYLYYATEAQISIARSDSPTGPFEEILDGPMKPETIRIDAHIFEDDDGQCYFYYVHFNKGNEIWGGKLKEDMVTVDPDSLSLMVAPDQPWEQHRGRIAEGAEMIKHNGTYYLTYSGSHFRHPNYAVGYATSDSPLGPWKKYEHNPIMKSTTYAHGTAHHCFTTSPDGKEHFIVYHTHRSLTQTEPRRLCIDRIHFVPQENGPDIIEVHGPTVTPQPLPSGVE